MEKSMAATSQKVSNYIPNDIVFSILSKLPLKSLKRFGCVCKPWGLLFENSHFMNIYRNHFESRNLYHDGNPLFLEYKFCGNEYKYTVYLLSGDKFENRVDFNLPPPLQDPDISTVIIMGSGSINGTICFSACFNERRKPFEKRAVLWNPATEEFKVIPRSPLESVPNGDINIFFHGFGYDRLRDDYKVIRKVEYYDVNFDDLGPNDFTIYPCDSFREVYSLRSNFWRKLNTDMVTSSASRAEFVQLYMDGMCHWWHQIDPHADDEEYLVSFDLQNDVFFTTPLPLDLDDNPIFTYGWRRLVVLNESIALTSYKMYTHYLHMSILGEIGVKESWTKLFIIDLGFKLVSEPIGAVKNGHILFHGRTKKLVLLDVSTHQMTEEVGVEVDSSCQMKIYKESFLPIGGLNI